MTTVRLFHATRKANAAAIAANGIEPAVSDKTSADEQRLGLRAVFGFDTIEAARDFAVWDNNLADDYAIFAFSATDPVADPEYPSGAWAVVTDEPVSAELVEIAE